MSDFSTDPVVPRETEIALCPVCSSAESRPTPFGEGSFSIVRCRHCRVWYLSPRLTEAAMLQVYEEEAYFEGGPSGYASYEQQERSLSATFDRLMRVMARLRMTGGALLDVGCGYGYLLRSARPYFSTQSGTDFSMAAVQRAQAYGTVYHGGLDALPRDALFDCITTTHVLEHVYRPVEFVQALMDRLRVGGWLLLAVPDVGSFWRKLMRRRWPSFKFPEHVAYYDRNTLRQLAARVADADQVIDVPYVHAFPFTEVCSKLGIGAPALLRDAHVWLPATTVAVALRKGPQDNAPLAARGIRDGRLPGVVP